MLVNRRGAEALVVMLCHFDQREKSPECQEISPCGRDDKLNLFSTPPRLCG
jgi:hypothetical protein